MHARACVCEIETEKETVLLTMRFITEWVLTVITGNLLIDLEKISIFVVLFFQLMKEIWFPICLSLLKYFSILVFRIFPETLL